MVQPQRGAASSAFTGADLLGDLLGSGEEYVVPGSGKSVWVFAPTPEDSELALAWSLSKDFLEPDTSDPHGMAMAQARVAAALKLAQVILCTRQGPSRADPRCFERADHVYQMAVLAAS